jgi:hypothetical protein
LRLKALASATGHGVVCAALAVGGFAAVWTDAFAVVDGKAALFADRYLLVFGVHPFTHFNSRMT